jgi:hypothetical protein
MRIGISLKADFDGMRLSGDQRKRCLRQRSYFDARELPMAVRTPSPMNTPPLT